MLIKTNVGKWRKTSKIVETSVSVASDLGLHVLQILFRGIQYKMG